LVWDLYKAHITLGYMVQNYIHQINTYCRPSNPDFIDIKN